jgi:hypothetical protein
MQLGCTTWDTWRGIDVILMHNVTNTLMVYGWGVQCQAGWANIIQDSTVLLIYSNVCYVSGYVLSIIPRQYCLGVVS